MTVEFLGTGTSHGIPVLACSCPVCRSPDARDARYRSSVLLRGDADEIAVIDAGPEFRLQALRAGLTRIDTLLVTHAHADHVHGIDDVRPLCRRKPVRIVGDAECIDELRVRFAYAFSPRQAGGGVPKLDLSVAPSSGVEIGHLVAIPVPLLHGTIGVLGWRIGAFAYLTDCSEIPESSYAILRGVSVVVVDGMRTKPHPTHFTVERAIEEAERIGASRAFITHICHDHSHAELEKICSALGTRCEARPAHDGLVIEI
ncbi:MAG: MBL fold metallo-hydrolase [Spirochaetes bacterium]|nr:MBL fold metallo-hydrolase [Spirochaetota bacterium]